MRHPAIELKNITTDENFAIAVLYKQKECLVAWLDYLNTKNISLPDEKEKYKLRINQINDAIKILEDESFSTGTISLKKRRKVKSSKERINIIKSNALSDLVSANTITNHPENMVAPFSAEFTSSDN